MINVLITGGAGFIGSNLVNHLVSTGRYRIRVIDNLSVGQATPCLPQAVDFRREDFTDRHALEASLAGIDVIVHLAAASGVIDSIVDPGPSFALNVVGSFQLLDLAHKAGIRRFINASTGGALLGGVAPPINESMAPSPLSPYGASKMAVEGYCSAFAGSYGLGAVTLRFSNIYGPRSAHKKSAVAAFVKKALLGEPLVIFGDGSQLRDYLFVGDLAAGIEAAIRSEVTGVYQLGSGRPASLKEMIETLEKIAGQRLPQSFEAARRGEVHATWCDVAKAQREIGFTAPTSFATGLAATWEWFSATRDQWIGRFEQALSDAG